MPPRTYYPLPPTNGTMHSLFFSTECHGFQGQNPFHLHTLSPTAPDQPSISPAPATLRAASTDDATPVATATNRSLPSTNPLNNIVAVANDTCSRDVADVESDCSVDSVANTTNAVAAPFADSVARMTLRCTAPNMDLSAPQAVDLTANIPLNNFAAVPNDNCSKDVVDADADSDCSIEAAYPVLRRSSAVAQTTHDSNAAAVAASTVFDADANVCVDAAFEFPARRPLQSASPNKIQSTPQAVDPTSVSSAPAALGTGTGADDGTGVTNAKLAASAASVRQTGVSEMNE